MSEFSDSLHFFNIEYADLKQKISERKVRAFIQSSDEKPFSALVDWNDREKVVDISDVIDYSYGEDHGLFLKFFSKGKLVGRCNKSWGPDFGYEEPEGSPNEDGINRNFVTVLASVGFCLEEDARKIVQIYNEFDGNNYETREDYVTEIGSLLKLNNYRWVSCEDLKYNVDILVEKNEDGFIGFS